MTLIKHLFDAHYFCIFRRIFIIEGLYQFTSLSQCLGFLCSDGKILIFFGPIMHPKQGLSIKYNLVLIYGCGGVLNGVLYNKIWVSGANLHERGSKGCATLTTPGRPGGCPSCFPGDRMILIGTMLQNSGLSPGFRLPPQPLILPPQPLILNSWGLPHSKLRPRCRKLELRISAALLLWLRLAFSHWISYC